MNVNDRWLKDFKDIDRVFNYNLQSRSTYPLIIFNPPGEYYYIRVVHFPRLSAFIHTIPLLNLKIARLPLGTNRPNFLKLILNSVAISFQKRERKNEILWNPGHFAF